MLCHTDAIRTTLDIDDALLEALLERLPGRSKTEAIQHAVASYLGDAAIDTLRRQAGRMSIEDVSASLRRVDRST